MKWSNLIGGVSPFYGSPLIRRYVKISRQCDNPQQLLAFIENDEWELGLSHNSADLDMKLECLSSVINDYHRPAQSFSSLVSLLTALFTATFAISAATAVPASRHLLAWGYILLLYCLYLAFKNTSVQRLKDCVDYLIFVRRRGTNEGPEI